MKASIEADLKKRYEKKVEEQNEEGQEKDLNPRIQSGEVKNPFTQEIIGTIKRVGLDLKIDTTAKTPTEDDQNQPTTRGGVCRRLPHHCSPGHCPLRPWPVL